MNERIRELLVEATEQSKDGKWNAPTSIWAEQFAELIVRECAELSVNSQYVNTKSEYYEGFNEASIYVGNKIKRHFGIEE